MPVCSSLRIKSQIGIMTSSFYLGTIGDGHDNMQLSHVKHALMHVKRTTTTCYHQWKKTHKNMQPLHNLHFINILHHTYINSFFLLHQKIYIKLFPQQHGVLSSFHNRLWLKQFSAHGHLRMNWTRVRGWSSAGGLWPAALLAPRILEPPGTPDYSALPAGTPRRGVVYVG